MVEIKGITGNITVDATSSTMLDVSAVKRGRDDDPRDVRIEVVEHNGGVTICALYPDVPGQPANRCGPGSDARISANNNDVEVTFTIAMPAGVDFSAEIVTGNVDVFDATGDVDVAAVTGNVQLGTTETATVAIVTGNITVDLLSADYDRDQSFAAVTGNVLVTVPAGANAAVELATVTGIIASDFALNAPVPGRRGGLIGTGGPDLVLATVTGNVDLRAR
jgi:DUF4097 and DUF4098 domain-containing protein YvlB